MDKTKIKALSLNVYYNDRYRGCAAGGVTEHYEDLLVVGVCDETNGRELKPFTNGYITIDGDIPDNAVVLIKTAPTGTVIFKLYPYKKYVDGKWYMMGGNYAATSDSRLGEAIREMGGDFYGALAVHDRTEG